MMQVRRLPIWRGSMASLKRRSTIGRRSSAGWTSPTKRLRQLEGENAKLKKLLAEQMLDAAALRELLSKNGRAVAKRKAVAHLQAVMGLSERRACGVVGADRKIVRYRSCRPPDTELRGHFRELAMPVGGSATAGCSCCCASRASRPGGTGSTVCIERKAPQRAQAPGSPPRRRHPSADPDRGSAEPPAGRWILSTTSSPAAVASGF
ncbi:hypothetical protein ACVWWO_000464 [Bradyrhizobium sp. F1.13.1]